MSEAHTSNHRWLVALVAIAVFGIAAAALVATDSAPSPVAAPLDRYDPVAAGEELPSGYRIAFGRDQIPPVYEPVFATADSVNWPPDALVIGVAGQRDAKAYPVTFLSSREMVIDHLEGIPILVTW